jgi:hypothetical protein
VITVDDGVVRLDDAGVTALLAGDDVVDASTARDLERAGLRPAMDTLREPLVTLEVLVAGTSLQVHRAAVDAGRAVLLLAVRPGLHQLMVLPPSHLAAALVRMTRVGPRRVPAREPRPAPAGGSTGLLSADAGVRQRALEEAAATLAWRLRVGWDGEHRDVVAVDGPAGPHVLDEDARLLVPVTATSIYRIFATALPPGALEQRA